LSSGFFLFGTVIIYSYTGTLQFEALGLLLANLGNFPSNDLIIGIVPGIVFMISGLFFKMYVFPFHAWVPDIYEGSPTVTGLFFATVPKIAIVGLVSRLIFGPF